MELAISIVALVVGVVALAVGVYHIVEMARAGADLSNIQKSIRDASDHLANVRTNIDQASKDLHVVQSSMSTHYLDPFPEFLDRIIDVITEATQELVVFCDYPGYAKFSEPQKASAYQYALEQALLRLTPKNLDVTCLNAEMRNHYRDLQFSEKLWADWQKDERRRRLVVNYLTYNGHVTSGEPSIAQLRTALQEADDLLLKRPAFSGAHPMKFHMPIYFWVADRRAAVFSIPSILIPSHPAGEQGFCTSDQTLIGGLLEIHQGYLAESIAEPVPKPSNPSNK